MFKVVSEPGNSSRPTKEESGRTEKKTETTEKSSEYFDKPVFLTVSGQLHLEAICNGISKVFSDFEKYSYIF